MKDTQPKTEIEFEEAFAEWMEQDEIAREFFEKNPEKKEMYKQKWFDSLRD